MPIGNLFKINQVDRNKFCTKVIEASFPNVEYYFLVILSTLIVALGLLADNIILVIGGMLVTPILSLILAIALGVVINEKKVLFRSLRIFGVSLAFAFLVAFITGLASSVNIENLELISKMKPSLLTLVIAIVAGLAASYTWVKPNLNDTLAGVAVTVTLVPPLTAIGLTASHFEWILFRDVLNVFLLNITGIILASLLVFSLMEFYRAKKKAVEEIKEEEKEIEKEKKQIQEKKLAQK
jgi:uncharacterized hydrophobic protein (TIGR00271 family)